MIYRCNLKGMEAEILLTRLQPFQSTATFPIDCNLFQSTATFPISKCRVSAGTDKLCMAHYLGGSKVLMPQVKAQLADRDRERLAWLCGMFGSKFEGERANAATLAYQLVRRAGLTWPDVIGTPMLTQSTNRRRSMTRLHGLAGGGMPSPIACGIPNPCATRGSVGLTSRPSILMVPSSAV